MKKFFIFSLIAVFITACSKYDDGDLWDKVNDLDTRVETLEKAAKTTNSDIESLRSLLTALQKNVYVSKVKQKEDQSGYIIEFTDNTSVTISNGVDGIDAPSVSVRKDEDGIFYWTIGGEWLLVDDPKVQAEGMNAIAPQVRINESTKMWELSTDNGASWTSLNVVAVGEAGKNGDTFFKSVDTSDANNVTFTLADGTTFTLPRTQDFMLSLTHSSENAVFIPNETKTYTVNVDEGNDFTVLYISTGWNYTVNGNQLTVTAPASASDGELKILVSPINTIAPTTTSRSSNAYGKLYKVHLFVTNEFRTLTFEDTDFKATPYTLDYANNGAGLTINTWSDLIDDPQYGGPLLYGDYSKTQYYWYDQNNTELYHIFPYNYSAYCYWGGGHAISNYVSTNLADGDFNHQLMVYGNSGHNGSSNFCMHYGYIDGSTFNPTENLPEITFYDGKARIIDHMFVNNSLYAMNCYINGNGLTTNIGESDWVKLVAIGYDADDKETGRAEFYMVNGPKHIIKEWTKWDLSVLGKVVKVGFNVTGSSDNGYGFSQPAYFAYDDVVVAF